MTIENVFKDIEKQYSKEIAQNVERIYRLETAHFTSQIYNETGGAGMLAFNTVFPWGWTNMSQFWSANPKYKPTGYISHTGVNQNTWNYLIFKNWGGFYTLAEFLKSNNNYPGAWYSTETQAQINYNNNIQNITPVYTA